MRMIKGLLIVCLLFCYCYNNQVLTLHAFANTKPKLRRDSMSQLPKRSEVPAEQSWKLEDLFESQAMWEKEYQEVNELVKKISQYEGKLTNAEAVKACFELDDEL